MNRVELQPGVVQVNFHPAEQEVFAEEVRDMRPQMPQYTEASFSDELAERGKILRSQGRVTQLVDFLAELSTHKGPAAVVFEFGADTIKDEEIGPTPTHYPQRGETQNLFVPDIYRGLVVALADWYGYGYDTQQNGVQRNNVVPLQEYEDAIGHSGTSGELGLHVEDASYNLYPGPDISPDFLTLHFFRNDQGIPTTIAIPDWEKLSPKTREILAEEWYFNHASLSQGGAKNDLHVPVSVLYGPNEDKPWFRYNTTQLNAYAYEPPRVRALVEFTDHLNQQQIDIPANKGAVVVIDNRQAAHGRRAFNPKHRPQHNGRDRWQRREAESRDPQRIIDHQIFPHVVSPNKLLTIANKIR